MDGISETTEIDFFLEESMKINRDKLDKIMWWAFLFLTGGSAYQGWVQGDQFLKVWSSVMIVWLLVGWWAFFYYPSRNK